MFSSRHNVTVNFSHTHTATKKQNKKTPQKKQKKKQNKKKTKKNNNKKTEKVLIIVSADLAYDTKSLSHAAYQKWNTKVFTWEK